MSTAEENPIADVTTAEPIGFASDKLVPCANCGRSNAPNKAKCLYCGTILPETDANAASCLAELRRIEAWETGFNLVLGRTEGEVDFEAATMILSMEPDELRQIIDLNTAIPILRVESEEAAGSAAKALSKLGIETHTIFDKTLDAEHPPIRIRAMRIGNKDMIFEDFNSDRQYTLLLDEASLIVTGRIYETRREEVTRRKRGTMKVLDEFETSGDIGVVDIYSKNDTRGFRLQTNGFDFSVLGDEKEILAGKNLAKLFGMFRAICVKALVSSEYDDVRRHLDLVWEPETKKDVQMRGFGKREFGATYITSNQMQFTKYSRMRRLMI